MRALGYAKSLNRQSLNRKSPAKRPAKRLGKRAKRPWKTQ